MEARDVMTASVEVIGPDASLEVAAGQMRELNIGALPVQDGGRLVGIITDRDMVIRAASQGLDPKTTRVGAVMTPNVISCREDQSVQGAASMMALYRIRRLVVVDGARRPVGIVSLDDLAACADSPALASHTLAGTSARPDRAHGFRRILVALDGSKFAERILPVVEQFAHRFGSNVTLLQAVAPVEERVTREASRGVVTGDWLTSADTVRLPNGARAAAERYLTDMGKLLEARGLSVELDCVEGEASDVILRRARQLDADLIAITTHGRTGVDRALFGSVAEDVLRYAPCPVLLVRVNDRH